MFRNLLTRVAAILALTLANSTFAQNRFEGESMGTTWHVTTVGGETDGLQEAIETELALVDRQMSTWRDDSEVSRFNSSPSTDWFDVSPETATVVQFARDVSEATDGAFDVTVSPLIDLWNFDKNTDRKKLPSDHEIAAAREHIGWKKLTVRLDPPAIRKSDPQLKINLSAIAKGYAVDRVAERIAADFAPNYLVEVGGEVRTAGLNAKGRPWAVGIEKPTEFSRSLHSAIPIQDRAMATSGDYRNFYIVDGKRYSHTIDPRTGRPVEHLLASVSILADSCMKADAWATAVTVLGPQAGAKQATQAGIAALLLSRSASGFDEQTVGNFPEAVGGPAEPVAGRPSSLFVFFAALAVFLVAIGGMAIGVIISNKRLKGSCGGLAGMTDRTGQTACDLCAMPSAECRGERAETNPLDKDA